eukprot:17602-Heterococcus_DN1.PRE.3
MTATPVDIVVIGKLIIDEHVGKAPGSPRATRLGGGSFQAAFGARAVGSSVGLIAPVGEDFASDEVACSSLQALHIDTQGVKALSGFKTPRLEISYEGESMVWKVYHLLAHYQYVDIIVTTHNATTTCSLQCGSAANLCAVQHWQPSAGWDKWAELQQCDLPLPASYSTAAALHALVEEGGAAESRMARKFKADHPAVLLSVEPI